MRARARTQIAVGGYQKLRVHTATSIKQFIKDHALDFARGRGFYQLSKPESISESKVVRRRSGCARA